MKYLDEVVTAGLELDYLLEAGAIERAQHVTARLAAHDNSSNQGLFEILYRHCGMSMLMVATWANRLRLEDSIRHSVESGTLRFEDAFAYFCKDASPTRKGLMGYLMSNEGKAKAESAVRAECREQLESFVKLRRVCLPERQKAIASVVAGPGYQPREGAFPEPATPGAVRRRRGGGKQPAQAAASPEKAQ